MTEGAELDQLKQMDEDELDEDILDDLGLDEETKTKFHEALRTLRQQPAEDEPPADDKELSEFDPAVIDAAAQAAAEREARWPKWPTLQRMLPGLPGLRGLHEADEQSLQDALRAKDAQLAAKDEELAVLRAQLERFS